MLIVNTCCPKFGVLVSCATITQTQMFGSIGNLLGRKAPTPAPQTVKFSFPPAGSSPSRRREDPRDKYTRVFRWKPAPEMAEQPMSVEIVGSFTRWQTISLTHDPIQDAWTVTIHDIPGKRTHHYMLLVNGRPAFDPSCDGYAMPVGFDEEQFALATEKGPRVLMLFSQTK